MGYRLNVLTCPFSWQCQNPCRLSLAYIIDWRVEYKLRHWKQEPARLKKTTVILNSFTYQKYGIPTQRCLRTLRECTKVHYTTQYSAPAPRYSVCAFLAKFPPFLTPSKKLHTICYLLSSIMSANLEVHSYARHLQVRYI